MKAVFFRNDDLGWMPPQFARLLDLFRAHDAKLCAAAIPMSCLEQYKPGSFEDAKDNLEIHVHGFTHLDFEGAGKKAEYGPTRNLKSAREDFQRGFEIVSELFPQLFAPVFTPPWNRIDEKMIPALQEAGYRAISTDGPERFKASGMREFNIDLDLHTSKKGKPSLKQILDAVETATKPVGIMLHHKFIDDEGFAELDLLLTRLKERDVKTLFYRDML